MEQKTGKLKLEEIPKMGTAEREMLLDITKEKPYTTASKGEICGFSEKELVAIEEKYKEGMRFEDILNAVKKKGWLSLQPSIIRHYIKVNQVPKPKIPREITAKGAISLYPKNFMRHLNLVRFVMKIGRKKYVELLKSIKREVTIYDWLLMEANDYCFEECDEGFFRAMEISLWRFEESGLCYAEEAVEKLTKNETSKANAYKARVKKMKSSVQKLRAEVQSFEEEAKKEIVYTHDFYTLLHMEEILDFLQGEKK